MRKSVRINYWRFIPCMFLLAGLSGAFIRVVVGAFEKPDVFEVQEVSLGRCGSPIPAGSWVTPKTTVHARFVPLNSLYAEPARVWDVTERVQVLETATYNSGYNCNLAGRIHYDGKDLWINLNRSFYSSVEEP